MARRCMTVYLNKATPENHVRTFGGNGSDVRPMVQLYQSMTKEQLLKQHPKFVGKCDDEFKLLVHYN